MNLHSQIFGEGSPFVILHGFLGMSDNWKTVGKKIADEGYEVHIIDQRNHGKSPHTDDFSYELMAEDLVNYCQDKGLKEIILMGHSMGGKTAMLAACENEGLVSKLIVVDIAPKHYAPHHQQILSGLTKISEANLESRGDAEDLLAEFINDKGIRLFLLKNLGRSKSGYELKLNLSSLKKNVENVGKALPDGAKFEGDTLFINGKRSHYILPADELTISHHFPNNKIVGIEDAGHWVHAEKMDEFFEAVMDFV